MSTERAAIRSYQRIFKPERRIYQIEGHRLPVPGGVPLRWLGAAIAGLLVVLVLSSRSVALSAAIATGAAGYGFALGGGSTATLAAVCGLAGAQVLGWMLGTLDWPLRLLVVPAAAATLATQATPDGRAAHRYAASFLALQLRVPRRSLTRALPALDQRRRHAARLWVAPDWRAPALRHARIHGPAEVRLSESLPVARSGPRGRSLSVELRSSSRGGARRPVRTNRVRLIEGERLDVRP